MKIKILISIFNSFFYLLYSIFVFIYLYESNIQFFLIFGFHICTTLIPIIKWKTAFKHNIFINSYFKKYDFYGKFIPLILIPIAFIFPENEDRIFTLSFIIFLFASVIPFIVELFFSGTILILKIMKGYDIFQLYDVEWKEVFKILESCTSDTYFIFDTENSSEYLFEIFSNNKNITFNCEDFFFRIDNININYSIINSMKIEYNKKLFEMNNEEIEIMKMMSI